LHRESGKLIDQKVFSSTEKDAVIVWTHQAGTGATLKHHWKLYELSKESDIDCASLQGGREFLSRFPSKVTLLLSSMLKEKT
jgi:hypothetical protein